MNTTTQAAPTGGSDGPMTPEQASHFSEHIKAQVQHVIAKVPLLGVVTWLMLQNSTTRHTLISELEWRVMPPLVRDQSRIYLQDNAPVAYVSWARLSDASAERYKFPPHHLSSTDWNSGENNWVVDLCAPFGGASDIIHVLRNTVFKGQALNQLSVAADGRPEVITWPASVDAPLA